MSHPYLALGRGVQNISHWIDGRRVEGGGTSQSLTSPWTGEPMATFQAADSSILERAIGSASKAFPAWSALPIKERTRVMFVFREELLRRADEIAATKSFESGKMPAEGLAGLMKGIEVLEFATALQNLDVGGKMEVSRGVWCEYRRIPLGVVSAVTPFNFPAMVPMWMIPIALTLGNSFIWKPSDKTPMTSLLIAECLKKAGLPDGVFNVVQGGRETVQGILKHPDVRAIGFVGSTSVAREVYRVGTAHDKRVLALGGAKNHIILLPDADPELAAQGIADSFTGCAGQRCMAAAVVLAVGDVDRILEKAVERVRGIRLGDAMGAIITKGQVGFLREAVSRAKSEGADVRVDGTHVVMKGAYEKGNWIAPTVLDRVKPGSEAATKELFGPVLSVIRCKDLSEALAIEAQNPYGNATSVFTSSGALADEVARHATSGMVGINIGVPVPREPFSFGGIFESKFGHGDITGTHSLDFWSDVKKVTTKWALQKDHNWMS